MDEVQERELRRQVADLVVAGSGAERLDDDRPDTLIELIKAADVVVDESNLALAQWVDAGRHGGLSWAMIGDTLGITRQAAQQRFSSQQRLGTVGGAFDPEDPSLTVRTGMTAFNEVAVLEEEGRNGRAVVGAAVLKLYFADRGEPWENIRVSGLRTQSIIGTHEEAGWTHAMTWFPFHYFTRPVQAA